MFRIAISSLYISSLRWADVMLHRSACDHVWLANWCCDSCIRWMTVVHGLVGSSICPFPIHSSTHVYIHPNLRLHTIIITRHEKSRFRLILIKQIQDLICIDIWTIIESDGHLSRVYAIEHFAWAVENISQLRPRNAWRVCSSRYCVCITSGAKLELTIGCLTMIFREKSVSW